MLSEIVDYGKQFAEAFMKSEDYSESLAKYNNLYEQWEKEAVSGAQLMNLNNLNFIRILREKYEKNKKALLLKSKMNLKVQAEENNVTL